MKFYKTAFVSLLGKGSAQPFKTAWLRAVWAILLATGLGFCLAALLPPLPFVQLNKMASLGSVLFIGQGATLLSFVAAIATLHAYHTGKPLQLMSSLPSTQRQLWFLGLLPYMTLSALCFLVLCWPITVWLLPYVHPMLTICSLLLGSLAALGIVTCIWRNYRWFIPLLCGWIALEYKGLGLLHGVQGSWGCVGIAITFFAGNIILAIPFLRTQSQPKYCASPPTLQTQVSYGSLAKRWWFVKKILRAHTTQLGLYVTFLLSLVLALLCAKIALHDATIVISLGALLAGAFSSDIRSVTKALLPVEIIGLRGTSYFLRKQFAATLLTAGVAILPLLLLVFQHMPLTMNGYSIHILTILGGVAAGICSGVVTARSHGIATQCIAIATALATAIVPNILLPDGILELIGRSVILIALVYIAVAIEYKRNNFIWKENI